MALYVQYGRKDSKNANTIKSLDFQYIPLLQFDLTTQHCEIIQHVVFDLMTSNLISDQMEFST